MRRIEYSQIVRRKLKILRARLTNEFGAEISEKSLKKIINAVNGLKIFAEKGVLLSAMYDIECDYRYLYIGHNYFFYRIDGDRIIIVEMFGEREDFMYKLFGISTTAQETIDYWNE